VKLTLDVTGIDLRATLHPLAVYRSDPTNHLTANQFARATLTPDGPATVLVNWRDDTASVELWGDGESWLADRMEAMLGLADDVSGFVPEHKAIARMWRQHSGMRMCASHTLWHDVAWLIPGQRVTGQDAARQWAAVCRKFSEPSPGPLELLLPPAPEAVAGAHYTDFHRLGIERQRAENLRAAARFIPRFAAMTDLPSDELRAKLELVHGVGPWTATNVLTMTTGDPDAVVIGDYGIPSVATWNLAGQRVGTDQEMLELLEPFRPNRWRVMRLLMAAGAHPPRRGPKIKNPRIARV